MRSLHMNIYFVEKRKIDRRTLNPTNINTAILRYSDRRFRVFRINETPERKELPGTTTAIYLHQRGIDFRRRIPAPFILRAFTYAGN